MATDAEIQAAKAKMDNAYNAIASAKSSMDSWYNLVTKCDTGKETVILGEQYEGECHNGSAKNHPGCADKQTCQKNMAQYNSTVVNWETANSNYEIAQDEYDSLKGQKADSDEGSADRDASQIKSNYYVFGAIVIALIIAGVVIAIKYKKK